jgi:hypothetical protein
MEIELDEGGRLLKPGFHDGHLLGIELIDNDRVAIKVRKFSGERYSLDLSGVERLLCNEFAQGNIVSEIYLMSGILPPISNLRLLMTPPHPSAAEEYHAKHNRVIQQTADLVAQRKLTFVAIEPSYGGELHALCRSVEITAQ